MEIYNIRTKTGTLFATVGGDIAEKIFDKERGGTWTKKNFRCGGGVVRKSVYVFNRAGTFVHANRTGGMVLHLWEGMYMIAQDDDV